MSDRKYFIGFHHAWRGLIQVIKEERNFKIHLIIAFIVTLFGFIFSLSRFEWLVLLLTYSSVLVAEMFNSAIERVIDYLKPTWHPQAKAIKDIAAGAVLLATFLAIIIGLVIFIPKIM